MSNFLIKNSEFVYEKDDIFQNDSLNRKVIIENLSNLIWSANQSFVISIESPWGTGKTVFVNLWKKYLEKENTPCIYFNAWENDFVSDPIVPFISALDEYLRLDQKINSNSKIGKDLKQAKQIGSLIARRSVPVLIKIVTQGVIDLNNEELKEILNEGTEKEISGLISDLSKDLIDEFDKKKTSIIELRKKLEDISKEFINKKNKKPPLVIFIDELDRCRPDFAILVLERLKHIFSVDGVVFVLSVDRSQLANSVKAIYGAEIDADGYLLRFIDFRFKLPNEIENTNFFDQLINKFDLENIIIQRGKSYHNYSLDNITYYYHLFTSIFKLSLREQEKFFTEFNLFIRLINERIEFHENVIIFLLILKQKDVDFFDQIVEQKIQIELFEEKFKEYEKKLFIEREKYHLGYLQGVLLKYLVTHDNVDFPKEVPREYNLETSNDELVRGKIKGFKIDEHKVNLFRFFDSYINKIKLIDRIL